MSFAAEDMKMLTSNRSRLRLIQDTRDMDVYSYMDIDADMGYS